MSFWKNTLKIFQPNPVRMVIRRGTLRVQFIGYIHEIGDYSCELKGKDGTVLRVDYDNILTLDELRL